MADLIKSIKVDGVSKKIDYTALANLPTIPTELNDTDGGYGQRVKALEDALNNTLTPIDTTIYPGGSVNIPSGIYSGAGKVSASLADDASEIDDTLKTTGSDSTIVPGGSVVVSGGKYYTTDSTITASLATTADQIDTTIKAPGVARTLAPGESYTEAGGVYKVSNTEIKTSLAKTETEIDESIKLGSVTYSPAIKQQTISAGKYLTGDQIIEALTADNIPTALKETQTTTASLTEDITVSATDGKVMTSVVVSKPDMTSADVNAADIVIGKKAYGANGTLITGTHVESGGTDTSDATATASDIVSGKTAYVADGQVTGTLEVCSYYAATSEPSTSLGSVGDFYMKLKSE